MRLSYPLPSRGEGRRGVMGWELDKVSGGKSAMTVKSLWISLPAREGNGRGERDLRGFPAPFSHGLNSCLFHGIFYSRILFLYGNCILPHDR